MRIILLFLMLLLVTSCGPKKAKTKAKLDLVSSFSSVVGALSAGGALVHGLNLDTNETFTIFPNENGEEISISSNRWSFQAFIWTGPNKLEGTLRCGKTIAELVGSDVTINLSVSQAGCDDISLIETTATTTGQPFPIRFAHCNDLSPITSGSNNCNSNLGSFGSYKISLLPTGVGEGLYSPLTTSCVDEAGLASGLTNSVIKVPFFAFVQDLFNLEVTSFSNSSCSGTITRFNSSQGLQNLSPNAKSFFDGTFSTLYLSKIAAGSTAGALTYLAPLSRAALSSGSYKTTIKVQAKIKNKEMGTSTNYKFKLSGETYPEKTQQKVSPNYKFILGN